MVNCPFCGGPSPFLLPKQVAQIMNVPHQTIRRWLREGRFPGAERKNIRGRMVWAIPTKTVATLMESR